MKIFFNRPMSRSIPDYDVIRSKRKSFGMEIKEGRLLVRAPQWAADRQIAQFVAANEDWIGKALAKAEAQSQSLDDVKKLSEEELKELSRQAKQVIPGRVAFYAPKVGVTYNRITIRCQKTRWGSCSAEGNLNFNCLLMLAPPEVLDSVVVHELCHRREMNHSAQFYQNVYRVFPEYDKWHKWLTDHGAALMARVDRS